MNTNEYSGLENSDTPQKDALVLKKGSHRSGYKLHKNPEDKRHLTIRNINYTFYRGDFIETDGKEAWGMVTENMEHLTINEKCITSIEEEDKKTAIGNVRGMILGDRDEKVYVDIHGAVLQVEWGEEQKNVVDIGNTQETVIGKVTQVRLSSGDWLYIDESGELLKAYGSYVCNVGLQKITTPQGDIECMQIITAESVYINERGGLGIMEGQLINEIVPRGDCYHISYLGRDKKTKRADVSSEELNSLFPELSWGSFRKRFSVHTNTILSKQE